MTKPLHALCLPLVALFALIAPFAAEDASATATGTISVRVTFHAEPTAAARTWRFEVVDRSGTVVETLTASTSGDLPASTAISSPLPHGSYTVRPILPGDAAPSCATGAVYELTSLTATVELSDGLTAVPFTIRACGVIADTSVLPQPGVVDEVRGTRSPGLDAPLPPATGDSTASSTGSFQDQALFIALGIVVVATSAASSAVTLARLRRRM